MVYSATMSTQVFFAQFRFIEGVNVFQIFAYDIVNLYNIV